MYQKITSLIDLINTNLIKNQLIYQLNTIIKFDWLWILKRRQY